MAAREDDHWTDRYDNLADVNSAYSLRFGLLVVFWGVIIGTWRGVISGGDGIWFKLYVGGTLFLTVGLPIEYLYLRRQVNAD